MVAGSAPLARAHLDRGRPVLSLGRYFDLPSKITGRTYRIFIKVPSAPPPAVGFPVIYILDGNWYFTMAAETAVLQAATGELPAAVLVGIGYPVEDQGKAVSLRVADLTLQARHGIPSRFKALKPGGADAFYQAIVKEIRPFVERRAAINRKCQTLFGHSFGGLFVLHTMFAHPESFRTFVAASPAIWWGDNAVLTGEPRFVAALDRKKISARLLMTVGSRERRAAGAPAPPGRPDRHMVGNVEELLARLARYRSKNFDLEGDVVENEGHNSSIPTVINKALHFGLCPPEK
jgi:predicted alpha/beta superfamily hydrolase